MELMHRLAARDLPPGAISGALILCCCNRRGWSRWKIAFDKVNRQAGLTIPERSLTRGALRTKGYRQAVSGCRECFEALSAWRYVTPGGLEAGSAWQHVPPAR
ncbi:hypothetical protein DEO72_LG7g1716 [Vigna unguiculata]|uniref:Uncharacterized protein n=1 Tax=Vigna unguiculata TaxID=3917 RepID=A0A4D6MGB0_VIGUN|nr:hypothetical protein DEO72_LG7g1716 [Vigna unguiculata]